MLIVYSCGFSRLRSTDTKYYRYTFVHLWKAPPPPDKGQIVPNCKLCNPLYLYILVGSFPKFISFRRKGGFFKFGRRPLPRPNYFNKFLIFRYECGVFMPRRSLFIFWCKRPIWWAQVQYLAISANTRVGCIAAAT